MLSSAGSSGVSRSPWFRPEAPAARWDRSTSVTREPRSANSNATAHPTTPPPTTRTSASKREALETSEGPFHLVDDFGQLLVGNDEGGADHQEISVGAVGAASRG